MDLILTPMIPSAEDTNEQLSQQGSSKLKNIPKTIVETCLDQQTASTNK